MARQTVEEQRRRILFELDAPIPAGEPSESPVSRRRPTTRAEQLEMRMQALRRQMAAETDGGRRLEIRDQLMQLGRQVQLERQSGDGRSAT